MSLYLYIGLMALTTYLIRMLPLTLFRRPIRSRFVKSFLHYVPYACLTAMTFPAILESTASLAGGVAANSHLRARMRVLCNSRRVRLCILPRSLCGDNGAMIGAAGYYELLAGHTANDDQNASAADTVGG